MEFYSIAGNRLGLREIPPLLASLIRQIPGLFEQDCNAAEERLFPRPSEDPSEEGLREDWKAHVEPELHAIFLSARQVVEADLRGFQQSESSYTLEFPAAHAESWLNVLNQARLFLAAQHQFSEDELSHSGPLAILSERDLAKFQIHFYAALQQWLVEVLETA
ncbi:MAG TPA: DUF2017 family protein [Terrimicrobiaceae bacterium]